MFSFENLECISDECPPPCLFVLCHMIADLLNVSEQAFDSSIQVTLVRFSLGPENVRGLLSLLKEVPDIGRPHLFEEFTFLVLQLFLFLLILGLPLLLLSVCQVSLNYLLDLTQTLSLERLKHDVILDILYYVSIDVTQLLICLDPHLVISWVTVALPKVHSL